MGASKLAGLPPPPLASLALGLHLVAMVSRGGDPQAGRDPIDRALAVLPPDALTLIMENDRGRVLETRVPPGETVPVHTHRWPGVNHILGWSDFVRRDGEGRVLLDTRGRPPPANLPFAAWAEALPPHTLENVGLTDLLVVSVEIKDGAGRDR